MRNTLEFELPLPPSKNKRNTWGKARIIGALKVIRCYRDEVAWMLRKFKGVLPDDTKIIVECVWTKTRATQDVHNWHAELADAIAPALGLNDRWFLIRDMDFVVEHNGAGRVWVQMRPVEGIV